MNAPTKEQRDEAVHIAAQFSRDYLYFHRIEPPALAKLIAHVRTQATNDPLDTPLPCDIHVGHVKLRKGVALRVLVMRMETLNKLAQEAVAHEARIATLEQQLEDARKDAERLDFIEKNARVDPKMDGNHVYWPTTFNRALRGSSLRAAIDAALQKEPT